MLDSQLTDRSSPITIRDSVIHEEDQELCDYYTGDTTLKRIAENVEEPNDDHQINQINNNVIEQNIVIVNDYSSSSESDEDDDKDPSYARNPSYADISVNLEHGIDL